MRKWRCALVSEPLNHIHQDTKSARLIAVCKGSFRGHTHRWRQIHVRSRQLTCFSLFTCPKHPARSSKKELNFYCIKKTTEDVTACKEQQSRHSTSSRLVSYFLFFYMLWRHLWSITVHYYHSTHTWKNVIYLLSGTRVPENTFKAPWWYIYTSSCTLTER